MKRVHRLARQSLVALVVALVAVPAATAAGKPLRKPTTLTVLATEYYAAPERWFTGKRVRASGLATRHRVDWLYSSRGVSMEGDGIGLDGRPYHLCAGFGVGWVQQNGRRTDARTGFRQGRPFWRAGSYWRNDDGNVTFPLESGGWFDGVGERFYPMRGARFCPGNSRGLVPYRSVAVDPKLIPLGSWVYIEAYRGAGSDDGWFYAMDTGGAIKGRHIDVYTPPPLSASATGQKRRLKVYVVPPKSR